MALHPEDKEFCEEYMRELEKKKKEDANCKICKGKCCSRIVAVEKKLKKMTEKTKIKTLSKWLENEHSIRENNTLILEWSSLTANQKSWEEIAKEILKFDPDIYQVALKETKGV